MRWERLILSTGGDSVTVRFDHRLTVVVGVGPLEREAITTEIVGALTGPRPGTNLELTMDDGRRLAVLRPGWGLGDRVLDVGTGDDVTADFTLPDGSVNLLANLSLPAKKARKLLRLSALDVLPPEEEQRLISVLASLSQGSLWPAAQRLIAARSDLEQLASDVGATPADTAAMVEVDERHREFEQAQDRCDAIRHHGIFTGCACAIGGIPAVVLDRWAALPFAVVAAAFTALSVVFRRRMDQARVAEEEALRVAGATTYGGFIHQRVAAMLGNQELRRHRVAAAVAEQRRAQAAWTALAGDVDVEWAVARQQAVAAAAARAGNRDAIDLAHTLTRQSPNDPRALAELVLARLDQLEVGPDRELMPLVLDEPFEGVAEDALKPLLEMLVRVAGRPQLVLLTEDPNVAKWAEAEQVAGSLSIVSPRPGAEVPAVSAKDPATP